MVAELVGAFNEVTERMSMSKLSTDSSRILFKTLKLSISILQSPPPLSLSSPQSPPTASASLSPTITRRSVVVSTPLVGRLFKEFNSKRMSRLASDKLS